LGQIARSKNAQSEKCKAVFGQIARHKNARSEKCKAVFGQIARSKNAQSEKRVSGLNGNGGRFSIAL